MTDVNIYWHKLHHLPILGTQAWIQKMPKSTLGQKLGNREWKIRVAKLEAVVG